MPNHKQALLNELTDMFYEVKPDEEYLKDNEEVIHDITHVSFLLHDSSTTIEDKIIILLSFNEDWFPNGLSTEEQKPYRDILEQAHWTLCNDK